MNILPKTIEELRKEREDLKNEREQLLKDVAVSDAIILDEKKVAEDLFAKKNKTTVVEKNIVKDEEKEKTEKKTPSKKTTKKVVKVVKKPDTEPQKIDPVAKEITEEEISKRANEIYEKRQKEGRDGDEKTDWEEAEKQLREEEVKVLKLEGKLIGDKEITEEEETKDLKIEKRDLSEVIKEFEKKAKDNLETGPLSERIRKGVLDGLTKWETFGQGEEGWKGFQHRMTKTMVNLVLIGGCSMLVQDHIIKNGLAAGSGFLTRAGTRLGFGFAMGSTVDVGVNVGGKKMSPEAEKRLQKLMPWITGVVSVAVATAFSGAIAAGAVAAGSAFLGYQASKVIKEKWANKHIEDKKEKAFKELYEKYGITDLATGEIDLKMIPKFEEDFKKLTKRYENISILGKLATQGAKVLVGTVVSVGSMEASGFAREHIGHHEATVESVKENEQQQNTETINKETEVKSEPETKQENIVPEKQTEPQSQPEIKTEIPPIEHKSISVEFSSRGAIQTILDMKEAIHNQYGDISKAPESIQEFMNTPATEEAIKLGLYSPNDPNGAESAMLLKGSTLSLDEHSILSLHDIKTGEDHDLISPYKEVSSGEVLEKYHGKMFDSDHSDVKIEETPHNTPVSTDEYKVPEQVDPITGEPIINTPHYDPTNLLNDEYKVPEQVDPVTGQPIIKEDADVKNQIISARSEIKHINTGTNLSTEELHQVEVTVNENINHLFPDKEHTYAWENVKDKSPSDLFKLEKEGGLNEIYKPLPSHIHKLEEVTGLHPKEVSFINPKPETILHFINRATEEAQRIGKIDEVRL